LGTPIYLDRRVIRVLSRLENVHDCSADLSRPVREILFDGTVLQHSYHGVTTTVTNALGQSRVTTINSQGQIVSVTDAAGETMTYGYDPFGNMLEARDPVGNVTTYTYDKRGRKLTWTDPDRGLCSYTYDVLDQLLTKTDAKGQVTSYSYDLLGRTIERAEPTLTSNWSYDTAPQGIGKPATASTNGGYQRSHSYDALGRPDQTTLTIDAVAYTYTTTYDGNGRVDQISYPSGLTRKCRVSGFVQSMDLRQTTARQGLPVPSDPLRIGRKGNNSAADEMRRLRNREMRNLLDGVAPVLLTDAERLQHHLRTQPARRQRNGRGTVLFSRSLACAQAIRFTETLARS
jgi:YD repeat-containing protein